MPEEVDRELGRGYAYMTDEEVGADLQRRFFSKPKNSAPNPEDKNKEKK